MAFAESLTVRILGDSSDLRGELGQVVAVRVRCNRVVRLHAQEA